MSCADFFWLDVMTEAPWSRHIHTGSQDSDFGTFEPSASDESGVIVRPTDSYRQTCRDCGAQRSGRACELSCDRSTRMGSSCCTKKERTTKVVIASGCRGADGSRAIGLIRLGHLDVRCTSWYYFKEI